MKAEAAQASFEAEARSDHFPALRGAAGIGSRAVSLAYFQTQLDEGLRVPRTRWWRRWSVPLLTLLGICAIALAIDGAEKKLGFGQRVLDALKLFPSGLPGRRQDESAELFIAKNLAAIVSGAGLLAAVIALYSRQLVGLRARMRRRHVVICGLGEKGLRSARAFRHRGFKVTCIDPDAGSDAAEDARARGAIVLEGDATKAAALTAAAADRASYVVCACAQDELNAKIAAHVTRLAARRRFRPRPTTIYTHIGSPELATMLATPAYGFERVRLQFFNIYELWASALVEVVRLDRPPGTQPHIVVVGCTQLGRAVVVAAARMWHFLANDDGPRLRLTLVDEDAAAHREALTARYPALPRRTDVRALDRPISAVDAVDFASLVEGAEGTRAVYLCLYDDGNNLALALKARHQLPDDAFVVVPATPWTGQLASLILTEESGIHAVGYAADADALDLLRGSAHEALAAAVHSAYRTGPVPRPESDLPWEALPAERQEANRRQVDGIVRGLRSIWYDLAPAFDWDAPPIALSTEQIETLAEIEHERWCAERRAEGWTSGERYHQARRCHPDLVPWEHLPEVTKEKDRAVVTAWPPLLAAAGYEVVRGPTRERLAEAIHVRHQRERLSSGDVAPLSTTAPWAELSDADRELSRASADDVALKLSRIGARIVPSWNAAPPRTFTEDEIERLAELEHARWCRSRLSQGWRPGPTRDDAAKIHPDLVPWDDLPEKRREIDREQVRAIPELLASVGLKAVREGGVGPPSAYARGHVFR